jgi:DNA-directed RNA polymerase subunit RPC12/RpoP
VGAPSTNYLIHYACFRCRRSFKRGTRYRAGGYVKKCPHCGGRAIGLGRHFKPPKTADLEQWKKVRFLVAAGFFFQHVGNGEKSQTPYPETLSEARRFVSRYRSQAWRERMPEALEILAEVEP